MAASTKVLVNDPGELSQWLSAQVIQGAANGFIQGSISTNVLPQNEQVLLVDDLMLVIETDPLTVAGTGWSIDVAVTRATKASMPAYTDPDLVARWRMSVPAVGTSVTQMSAPIEMPIELPFQGKQLIASSSLFFQFDTTGMSAALTATLRLYYKSQAMKKSDILDILYG